ncbi:UDP-N-acetylmuramate--L-alanine ligase [Feifania hominis]|uniref:UDP-N-acetylmuramate--L-alanine ligase n=1 Tax=Feifania hominis TaxID=2763660 RepID=A0A926DBZ1_9FIRM|nr:UDP-N-acetylmuramate--L-alanine ligase [Feifania hominis]MBC8535748.1 UDP-N-acetylmuramate--L-alanine ligase [Feifania hominis]
MSNHTDCDFTKIHSIHFAGIGGVSMSALAEIMLHRGYTVTGSDINDSETVAHLRERGAKVAIGHRAENVAGADLFVYTAAIKKENPEYVYAEEHGIPIMERAVFLGAIMRDYACPIGVAGTHGKTTTTSMLSQILLGAGLDPTVLVGGTLPLIGGNYHIGSHELMVFEACEYVDSFLNFCPKVAIVLNVEADHLDYFKDLEAIKTSFAKFESLCGPDGTVIVNADDPNALETTKGYCGRVITFSTTDPSCDYYAHYDGLKRGFPEFHVTEHGEPLGEVILSVPGRHNVLNALASIAAARLLKLDFSVIRQQLEKFTGANRRFQLIGKRNEIVVVDDYAHHPSEIRATLLAAKNLHFNRIICVFQPHTYSRTRALFDDFAAALRIPDVTFLCDIYAAREKNTYNISSQDLARDIPGAVYCGDFETAAANLRRIACPGDLILTMGAGDVYRVGHLFLD